MDLFKLLISSGYTLVRSLPDMILDNYLLNSYVLRVFWNINFVYSNIFIKNLKIMQTCYSVYPINLNIYSDTSTIQSVE